MSAGFDIITIFPEMFSAYLGESILKRAAQKGLLDVKLFNPRDFTSDRHRTVDDYPYGGGAGMVMKAEPIYNAIDSIKADGHDRLTILMTPQGKTFTQGMAESLS